jgi:hypothetical protein
VANARDKRVRELEQEADRYRAAAEHTLEHLEWCVKYLHRIRKPELANQLERNRKQILDRL